MLVDESGFMLQPLVRRTWAERGKTPVLEQWDRRDRTSVITALALSPKRRRIQMFFQLLDHNARAEDFIWFLNDLRVELGRKLHVVWDNLRPPQSRERLAGDRVQVGTLPAAASYAPELNPVEHVWATAKWGHLAGVPPDDIANLRERVQAATQRSSRRTSHSARPLPMGQPRSDMSPVANTSLNSSSLTQVKLFGGAGDAQCAAGLAAN
ncbi:MAG: transposase [Pirellulales bacterium]